MLNKIFQLMSIMVLLMFLLFIGICTIPLMTVVAGAPGACVVGLMLLAAFVAGLHTIIKP